MNNPPKPPAPPTKPSSRPKAFPVRPGTAFGQDALAFAQRVAKDQSSTAAATVDASRAANQAGQLPNLSADDQKNTTHEWLKYESTFNHIQFTHTPQRLPMASYQFPVKQLRVLLLQGLPERTETLLRDAFFPTLTLDEFRRRSTPIWKLGRNIGAGDRAQVASLVADHFAHMPYNAVSNSSAARALGTRPLTSGNPVASPVVRRLEGEWAMWQTASRSCVVELGPTAAWTPVVPPSTHPGDGVVNKDIEVIAWDYLTVRDYKPFPRTPVTNRDIKTVSDLWNNQGEPLCYSIKTGVCFIGSHDQSFATGGKAVLEKESFVSALRSQYLLAIEGIMQTKQSEALDGSTRLIVLPEILTVTNLPDYDASPTWDKVAGVDGFQLRDLARLDRNMKYFPPISIPYVGVDVTDRRAVNFDTRTDYFAALSLSEQDRAKLQSMAAQSGKIASVDDEGAWLATGPPKAAVWANYWSMNFAARIGQAKALLHIVYGLQCLTPNAQNFLLEYDRDMEPTFRVVVRDILDTKIVSDWVATLFGDSKTAMDTTPRSIADVNYADLPTTKTVVDLLRWEVAQQLAAYTEARQTQLNFVAYTALHKGSTISLEGVSSSTGPARPANWQWILATNTDWALWHAYNYIDVVNATLGLEIPFNTFDKIPLDFTAAEMDGTFKNISFIDTDGKSRVINKDGIAAKAPFDFHRNAASFLLLTNVADDYKRAGQLYQLFCKWEETVAARIHRAIYGTSEAREKLRKFHGFT